MAMKCHSYLLICSHAAPTPDHSLSEAEVRNFHISHLFL